MQQPDDRAARAEDPGAPLSRLGPPGWAEFAQARERFMRTVAVAGLETAWTAPAREPVQDDREDGRP